MACHNLPYIETLSFALEEEGLRLRIFCSVDIMQETTCDENQQ
jgi:hypothetical protein